MIPGAGNILVFDTLERAWRGDSLQDGQRSADIMPASQIVVPNETRSNRSNAYFPLDYLPQAIGMKIAMLVNLLPYAQWQAARISNSILYAIMGVLCHCAVTALEIADGVAISYSTGGVCGIEPDD